MPEPTKTRLTLANVAVMLPIELLVHAAVVGTHLPYVAKVLVLTLIATILVIWVAEPSATQMLRTWLHAPGGPREAELLKALRDGGGSDPHVWPTTALAMADGQTGALSLAARIAANPEELPLAVAELLHARIEDRPDTDTAPAADAAPRYEAGKAGAGLPADGSVLSIPTAWHGPITFSRPGEPFTPAESARAHRLAELAEILAHRPVSGQ
jgi:hypothetical protein